MPDQIPDGTMKMITDEAWEFFRAEAGVGTDKLRAFTATIKHAFYHAFEEGIITSLDYDKLREIRRSTEIGKMHDDIAQDINVKQMAAALAMSEGFNPHTIPPDIWERAKGSYEHKARNVIKALESMNG